MRREEVCKLLRRHYLRERDPSLKELSKKLQAGYVCRDLQQQILHNEYRRLQEKVGLQLTSVTYKYSTFHLSTYFIAVSYILNCYL